MNWRPLLHYGVSQTHKKLGIASSSLATYFGQYLATSQMCIEDHRHMTNVVDCSDICLWKSYHQLIRFIVGTFHC